MAHVQMVNVLVPRGLNGGILLDGVGDSLSNLAPLGDPIPNGRPHFHRVVVKLS